MKTVTIYKVTIYQAYSMSEQGTRFSLSPWGEDTIHYKGYDDGGVEYILPEGYTLETDEYSSLRIANDKRYFKIDEWGGRPIIYDKDIITLKKA